MTASGAVVYQACTARMYLPGVYKGGIHHPGIPPTMLRGVLCAFSQRMALGCATLSLFSLRYTLGYPPWYTLGTPPGTPWIYTTWYTLGIPPVVHTLGIPPVVPTLVIPPCVYLLVYTRVCFPVCTSWCIPGYASLCA